MGKIRFRTFIAAEVAAEHEDDAAYEVVERLSELPPPDSTCPSPDPSDSGGATTPAAGAEYGPWAYYDPVPDGVTEA